MNKLDELVDLIKLWGRPKESSWRLYLQQKLPEKTQKLYKQIHQNLTESKDDKVLIEDLKVFNSRSSTNKHIDAIIETAYHWISIQTLDFKNFQRSKSNLNLSTENWQQLLQGVQTFQEPHWMQTIYKKLQDEYQDTSTIKGLELKTWAYKTQYFSPFYETQATEGKQLLDTAEDSLDQLYFIQKLHLRLEAINRSYMLQETASPKAVFFDQMMQDYLEKFPIPEQALVQLYLYCYLVLFEYNPDIGVREDYLDKVVLQLNNPTIASTHKEYIAVTLSNFFNTQRPKNHIQEIHKLQQLMWQHQWIVQSNGLVYFCDGINALTSSLSAKDSTSLDPFTDNSYAHFFTPTQWSYIHYLAYYTACLLKKDWQAIKKISHPTHHKLTAENQVHYTCLKEILDIRFQLEYWYYADGDLAELDKTLSSYAVNNKRKEKKLASPFTSRNQRFINQIKQLLNILTANRRKKDYQEALQQWQAELKPTHLYYNWLTEFHDLLQKKYS